MPTVTDIYRYPVKGLSAERLDRCDMQPGEGLPLDRAFALAHGTTQFEPENPQPLPKTQFLMLAVNERLATLRSTYDDTTGLLTINRDGRPIARAHLDRPAERSIIEQFFAAYMKEECRGSPRLVQAPGHSFADCRQKLVSLIGRASIQDLERVIRRPINPLRFRANVYFDDAPAWSEFDWLGREVQVGTARLKIVKRINRCPATNVDPASAKRDMNIPLALRSAFGHIDMGVYAEVTQAGSFAAGDAVNPL